MKFSEIKRITQDSREVKPGDWFVACAGEEINGHDFIPDALAHGAAGVLEEEELFELARQKLEAFKPKIIGITGSVGKTTTKEAVATVLAEKYRVLKSLENINTRRGLSIYILNELQKDHEVFAAELAMDRFGEIGETCQTIKPDIAVITAITETHLEKLGSLARIKETKAEILDALAENGVAVLNRDDPNIVDIATRAPGKIIWFGVGERVGFEQAGFWAGGITVDFSGTSFLVSETPEAAGSERGISGSDPLEAKASLLGKVAVYSFLAGVSVGRELGLSFSEIKNGLLKLKPVPQRLNLIKGRRGILILDDSYNASDVSTLAALEVLLQLPGRRRIAVLGDMLELGAHEKKAHRIVGEGALGVVDALIVVGKLGKLIGDRAKEDGFGDVHFAKDNKKAISILGKEVGLRAGDMVLVKGSRGAKMEEIVRALS